MEELKPVHCGCGGEAKVYIRDDIKYIVICEDCGIVINRRTVAEAIKAWNCAMSATDTNVGDKERTAKVVRVDRKNFKCLACGQNFHAYMWAHPTNYCSFCGAKLDWSGNEIE